MRRLIPTVLGICALTASANEIPNQNFLNEQRAFPSKVLSASLNVYTFNMLYAYGYTNVYELGPLIEIDKSRIPFEGRLAAR